MELPRKVQAYFSNHLKRSNISVFIVLFKYFAPILKDILPGPEEQATSIRNVNNTHICRFTNRKLPWKSRVYKVQRFMKCLASNLNLYIVTFSMFCIKHCWCKKKKIYFSKFEGRVGRKITWKSFYFTPICLEFYFSWENIDRNRASIFSF